MDNYVVILYQPNLKKVNKKFGSPTHYDGTHHCYKKCPKGMTSKGNGKDWNKCYYKKNQNQKVISYFISFFLKMILKYV